MYAVLLATLAERLNVRSGRTLVSQLILLLSAQPCFSDVDGRSFDLFLARSWPTPHSAGHGSRSVQR